MEEIGWLLLVGLVLGLPIIFLVLLLVYIGKTNTLTRKIDRLEGEIRQLRLAYRRETRSRQPVSAEPQLARGSPPVEGVPGEIPARPQPMLEATSGPATPSPIPPRQAPTRERPTRPSPQSPAYERPRSPTPPPPHSRTRAEWEALIGGRLLNRIGAFALVLGIGFFLKYAFDRNWISEWTRVSVGLTIGASLLLLGWRFRRKGLPVFAQGLVGAGIAILYLSVYASFNFYHLVSQPVAFGLMSVVTLLTFSLAVGYNSIAVALLGWAGGFLTPWLLSTGQANQIGLFSYIALLDVAVLAILARKGSWVVLEPMTLVATYLWYLVWYQRFYQPADLLRTALFLSIFWLLFLALDFYRNIRGSERFAEVRQAVAMLNGVFFYYALYEAVNPVHPDWMGLVTLAIGAVYFLLIFAIRRPSAFAFARHVLSAVILLALATAIQFSGFTTVFYWSLEGLFLVWCGTRWRRWYVWQAGTALLGLSLVKLFATHGAFNYSPIESFALLLNRRAMAFAALAVGLGLSGLLLRGLEEKAAAPIRALLHYGWGLIGLSLCSVELIDYFAREMVNSSGEARERLLFNRGLVLSAVWALYSLPLVWSALRSRILPSLQVGLAAVFLAAGWAVFAGFGFEPVSEFRLVLNQRFVVFLFVVGAMLAHFLWLRRKRETYQWADTLASAFVYVLCVFIFISLSAETVDFFRLGMVDAGTFSEIRMEFVRDMILAIVWTAYSLILGWYGVVKKQAPLLHCGIGVLVLAIAMAAIRGFTFEPIQEFTPGLNIRLGSLMFVTVGLILQSRLLGSRVSKVAAALGLAGALILFELMTCETKDLFARAIYLLKEEPQTVSLAPELTRLKNLQQMYISLVWVVYSILLMAYGIIRRRTLIRMLAMALFGVAILKIFIYDLSFLETLYRIFSFLVLGLILLVVSYLYQRYKSIIFDTGPSEEPIRD